MHAGTVRYTMARQLNLLTVANQRWREGRDSYVLPREPLRTSEYEVVELEGESEAKAFLRRHHYLKNFPAARRIFSIYRHAEMVGLCVYAQPGHNAAGVAVFNGTHRNSVELKRLCLLEGTPYNLCSHFCQITFNILKRTDKNLRGVITYSDPMRRTTLDGRTVTAGHVGSTFQSLSGIYLGRSRARKIKVLPDGSTFNERTIAKIRAKDSGWMGGVRQLVEAGADEPGDGADLREWLDFWLPQLTRTYPHPGNFKYGFPLKQAARKLLGESKPYPKEEWGLYVPREDRPLAA